MWKKARKKPVVIEFREVKPNTRTGGFNKVEEIKTLEGTLIAIPNKDFVIRGVRGELYPIKKNIFYETYDVIEE
jgi:hypothetical protein